MPQQIIIDIHHKYPFAQIKNPSPTIKVFVRKIIRFTQANYNSYKAKFQYIKSLRNSNIISLLNVLQQGNKFHLIYEYVPHHILMNGNATASAEYAENLNAKMIYLSTFLLLNQINTKFDMENMGLDSSNQLKYYLDVDFDYVQNNSENVKIKYLQQCKVINQKILKKIKETHLIVNLKTISVDNLNLYSHNSIENKKKDKSEDNSINPKPFKRGQWNSKSYQHKPFIPQIYQNQQFKLNQQKVLSKNQALSILNDIQRKINSLKSRRTLTMTMDRSTQNRFLEEMANRRIKSSKSIEGQFQISSKIQQWKKQKQIEKSQKSTVPSLVKQVNGIQKVQASLFNKKIRVCSYPQIIVKKNKKDQKLYKMKTLQLISQTQEQNIRKQSSKLKLSVGNLQKSNDEGINKNPQTKQDFEKLKQVQFKSFLQCKQSYIHQFMDILTNDNRIDLQIKTKREEKKQLLKTCPTSQTKIKSKSNKNNQTIYKKIHTSPNKKINISDIKRRISNAILKSDITLQKLKKSQTVSFK